MLRAILGSCESKLFHIIILNHSLCLGTAVITFKDIFITGGDESYSYFVLFLKKVLLL